MNNTTYGKRTDLQREGACSKDIWRLYFSLPQNTYFDLYIISSRSGEELEHIGFAKCGCAMEEKPIPDDTRSKLLDNYKFFAGKIADKMKWIAIRPEVFEEKNNIIRNELNRYLEEIDNSYKNNRGRILQQQVDELKGIIIQKITGYKGIDENLIRRITNVAETQIPPSSLKALKMDEYINKQKAIFIFSTNNKKNYKADVEQMFANTTKVQFDSYINEIMDVARDKTAELIQEFKNNIDSISSSLELLIKDEKKASEEQLKAKSVLDMVSKMDDELNKKIWGQEEIKQAEDVILGKDKKEEEKKEEEK